MAKNATGGQRLSGPASLFRHKIRRPVTLTLTAEHHRKVQAAMRRLGLTRADVIGLLIERYADVVGLPGTDTARRTK